ncbi:phage portal protein [Lactobacillus crispatus]|uniref:phage portal protein n=1 Tax=Lactobacillus crispatus TaxID=47770 RepID=UPI000F8567B9|nr:phage portal protein [Lactobacillus crispatus]DAJ40162.1 MAG TPA: portal protein [Caudoviricetes sp.]AZR15442.1 phage portal protein [Lactobacillus crispatus]MBI1719182.1 phage portal protein [Lactobacillus crispatus]MCT7799720.1 phage portal protein [Lactobacillus crispatus]MCZ9601480.1 phage portal protein [Lactobacillus crispatus]
MGLLSRASPKFDNNVQIPSMHGLVFTQLIGNSSVSMVPMSKAMLNSDVFSAIHRIASDIASAKFKTDNTYIEYILNRPSSIIGRFSFWQGVISQLLLAGNAYVVVDGMNLVQYRPTEISNIQVIGENVGIEYTVTPLDGSKEFKVDQNHMLHFRIMPDSSYQYLIGRSPLESLAYEMTISDQSKKATLNSVQNQISPIGILSVPASQLNDEDRETARTSFEKMNSGANAGRLMVLTDDFKFSQLDVKADVFKALTENADYSAAQISKAFGIPVDMLGGGKSTESQHSNIDSVKGTYIADLNSYTNPLLDEVRLKFDCPNLKLDIKSALDVDDSIAVGQANSMVQAGTIDQGQAQQLLKRSGTLPVDLIPPQEGGDDNGN